MATAQEKGPARKAPTPDLTAAKRSLASLAEAADNVKQVDYRRPWHPSTPQAHAASRELDELLGDDSAAVTEVLVRDRYGTQFWIGVGDLLEALQRRGAA